jgi:hypothetical protein
MRIALISIACVMGLLLLIPKATGEAPPATGKEAQDAYFKLEDLKQFVSGALRSEFLYGLKAAEGDKVVLLTDWEKAPVQVQANAGKSPARFSARVEDDFFVIWYRHDKPLDDGKQDAVQAVRNAIKPILQESLVLGNGESIWDGTGQPGPGHKFAMMPAAQRLPDGTVIAGYANLREQDQLIERIHVLIKDNNVVIAASKAKARQASDEDAYIYEALAAVGAKKAENVIYSKAAPELPKPLANACLWPIRDSVRKEIAKVEDLQKP